MRPADRLIAYLSLLFAVAMLYVAFSLSVYEPPDVGMIEDTLFVVPGCEEVTRYPTDRDEEMVILFCKGGGA